MPFAHDATFALEAATADELAAELDVVWKRAAWSERSRHFHAPWNPPTTFASKPPLDWNPATIEGEGLYVGNVLNIVSRNAQWWGEGDEKIDVLMPSATRTRSSSLASQSECAS